MSLFCEKCLVGIALIRMKSAFDIITMDNKKYENSKSNARITGGHASPVFSLDTSFRTVFSFPFHALSIIRFQDPFPFEMLCCF